VNAPTLAIDIGGTKIMTALVAGAHVADAVRVETPRGAGAEAWLDAVVAAATPLRGRYARAAAAVSGVIVDGRWSAANPATLPVPDRFPLVAALEHRLGVPVGAWNDAHAAAWGEWRHGAGAGRDMAFVTVSSGIGGGLVLGSRLLVGARGLAGSIGQMPVRGGLLEDWTGGLGLARRAAALGHEIDAAAIWRSARSGTGWARDLMADALSVLAEGLATFKLAVDPDVIVIGGGLGLADGFVEALSHRLAGVGPLSAVPLVPAALGASAGLVGAADLAAAQS